MLPVFLSFFSSSCPFSCDTGGGASFSSCIFSSISCLNQKNQLMRMRNWMKRMKRSWMDWRMKRKMMHQETSWPRKTCQFSHRHLYLQHYRKYNTKCITMMIQVNSHTFLSIFTFIKTFSFTDSSNRDPSVGQMCLLSINATDIIFQVLTVHVYCLGNNMLTLWWRSCHREMLAFLPLNGVKYIYIYILQSTQVSLSGVQTCFPKKVLGLLTLTNLLAESLSRLRGNHTEELLVDHLRVIEWHEWLAPKHHKGPLGQIIHDIAVMYGHKMSLWNSVYPVFSTKSAQTSWVCIQLYTAVLPCDGSVCVFLYNKQCSTSHLWCFFGKIQYTEKPMGGTRLRYKIWYFKYHIKFLYLELVPSNCCSTKFQWY